MKDIDKIFSKLKDTEIESPDIWNRLESQLGNTPQTNISSNLDKVGAGKSLTLTTILKTVGIVASIGAIGIGSYLIVDNINDRSKEETIFKTQVESPKTSKESIDLKNKEKTINFEEAKLIIGEEKIICSNPKKEELTTTFKVSDESNIVLENNNYSIKTTNTAQSYPSEITIDYVKEDSSKAIEKALPIISEIPKFKPSNVITPNGDGKNDVFVIRDVDKFPDNCLIIFDRNGKSVYKCRGYKNNFNALNIPLGSYFYKFEYNDLGKKVTKVGSITVM
ncbi:MAG: gliding motility-associated C-terminal domain-containing protein [Bacteroidales bacterium]|nr:gliding motility-associated C-terminal domain-containing protein [Bacteroidales bacterium]